MNPITMILDDQRYFLLFASKIYLIQKINCVTLVKLTLKFLSTCQTYKLYTKLFLGEHMTEYELAEYLTTLLGFNAEGGSSELQEFDVNTAGDIIDQNLPHHITGEMFANEVLGFSMYNRELPSAGSQS